ncbi:MAG: EthD family reductase [Deltaproteobacteria bacterium]|nr:EthD family reductase [Deltaproteobacteria bacterium]
MVKLIACLKRKPGVSVEQSQRHWRTQHAEIVVRQEGLRRYVQNHVAPESYAMGEPAFDGVAEAWFDDVDAMRRLAPSAEYRAVRDDEPHFLDVPAMKVVLADEFVAKDGPESAGALKLISFLTRKPGLTPEAFQQHWREVHAPLVAAPPAVRRYVQSHARLGGYAGGRAPAYDGVALLWFDDEAGLRAPNARARADGDAFMAPGPPPFVLTRPHVVLGA